MNKYVIPGVVAVVALVGISAYAVNARSANDEMMKKEVAASATASTSAADSEAMMMKHKAEQETMSMTKDAGAAYIGYTTEADAQKLVSDHGKDVVYFFSATWCPDCQALEKNLTSATDLAKLGKNTVIVKVELRIKQPSYELTRRVMRLRRRYSLVIIATYLVSSRACTYSFCISRRISHNLCSLYFTRTADCIISGGYRRQAATVGYCYRLSYELYFLYPKFKLADATSWD
jgi:thiol-disulfide isomerase/thioredoxin